jgi:REP element-mobilizing transposase RayT
MEQEATSWEEFDHEKLDKYLADQFAQPAVQAHLDQTAAQMVENRDEGLWWAALVALCNERNQMSASAVAGNNLRHFLEQLDARDLSILTSYLLHNTVHMVAKYECDDVVASAVSAIIGPHNMMIFEKFAATGGHTCPQCGTENWWNDHECKEMNPNE